MYELPDIRWIIDRAAVVDTIVAVANAIDAQDWQKVRSHLADEIDLDYSEFRGETPRRVTAEEYIKSNPQLKCPPIFLTQNFLLPGSKNCARISNPLVIELFPNPHKNLRD